VFFVFHTMGSHFAFENRYPPERRHFSAQAAASKREHLVNTYDDSIRYTDHFLAEVIARLEARPDVRSAMLFVSDHGENLLDDERELFGHAMGTAYDLRTAGFFWYSDALARARPDAIEGVHANARRRVSTANVFHTLADLGGIEADEVDLSKSLLRATLADRRRLFTCRGAVADYDALFAPAASTTAPGATPR
jgi:glucan phosphoethanolaminetransferase (alkaline phosphatase superfamily)